MITAQVAPVLKSTHLYADGPTAKEKRPLQQVLCAECESIVPSWHLVGSHACLCQPCQHRAALAQFVPHER